MQIRRKDIGYTLYSRLEEGLRSWVRENLLKFGDNWRDHIPVGIWDKITDKSTAVSYDKSDDPADMLEETDLPDIAEILCYKGSFKVMVPQGYFTQKEFQERMRLLYNLRCKIAHVKRTFTAIDLDLLIDIAKEYRPMLGMNGNELEEALQCIRTNPASVLIHIPPDFFLDGDLTTANLHNLPSADYDPDGGFIGRRDDLKKIKSLVLGDLDRVVTISGAGGVGKTALAHRFCVSIVQEESIPFGAVVWISAKEEKLTLTGIEPIEPSFRNYEEVLDRILEVYDWDDVLEQDLPQKEKYVDLILRESDKGILLVVDNLETIQDERILEFIKDCPLPNKVLITSRIGLGEVERRYVLKEMSKRDAITLLRIVGREKGLEALAKLPDSVLNNYAQKMCRYPLTIKWVVGQVALGKDIDHLVESLSSTSGDIARFCFEHIFDNLLSDNSRMVLYCLAASDVPLTRGVLTHVSGLQKEELDEALRGLALASLVVPENSKREDNTIITKHALLPLTLGYLKTRLHSQPALLSSIQARMEVIGRQLEEAVKVSRQYRYALQHLGAATDEERIAASWALTAYQRSQIGDYSGAVQAFNRAVEIAPNFSRLYRNWAVVESSEGYYERANELMKKATKLTPEDASLWFVWGNIEKRSHHLDQARKHFKKALSLSPNDGAILGGLGEVEKRFGKYKEAEGYFQKALAVPFELKGYKHKLITYTAFAGNYRRWSELLLGEKQYDEALIKAKMAHEYASKAVDMAKGDERAEYTQKDAAYNLGRILFIKGDVDEAVSFLKRAITNNPKRMKDRKLTSYACYQLSLMFLKDGKREEAEYYYRMGERIVRHRAKRDRESYNSLKDKLFQRTCTGKILKVFKDKGYGFIEREDAPGQSIFAHITQFVGEITADEFFNMQGSKVSFTIKETSKGAEAQNVKLVD